MAHATAHSNIALVKYWGKRDAALNLPAAGSLSLTLRGLKTTTSVEFDPSLPQDRILLNDTVLTTKTGATRLTRFLDLIRKRAGISAAAHVHTTNTFPTSAGLASSASGFAALAGAGAKAAGLDLSPKDLSILARLGSGSAARSIYGGWAEMLPGARDSDGSDAYAVPLHDADHWDLHCVVALCAQGSKKIGSTDGMTLTMATSPYYDAWVNDVPTLLAEARAALASKDFEKLAMASETSCMRMHASAIASAPGVLYWNAATVALIHAVRDARAHEGIQAFFTIDAGPHVKIFCAPSDLERVIEIAQATPGVHDLLRSGPGPGLLVA